MGEDLKPQHLRRDETFSGSELQGEFKGQGHKLATWPQGSNGVAADRTAQRDVCRKTRRPELKQMPPKRGLSFINHDVTRGGVSCDHRQP